MNKTIKHLASLVCLIAFLILVVGSTDDSSSSVDKRIEKGKEALEEGIEKGKEALEEGIEKRKEALGDKINDGIDKILTTRNKSTTSYSYYCDECGDGISRQPYQCILYNCVKAKTVSSVMDKFCSCSCGVSNMRRKGFSYQCN